MIPNYSILIDWISASPLRDTLNKYFNNSNFWGTLIIYKDSSTSHIEYRSYNSNICYKTTFSNVNSQGLSKTYDISGYYTEVINHEILGNIVSVVNGNFKMMTVSVYSKKKILRNSNIVLLTDNDFKTKYINLYPRREFFREFILNNLKVNNDLIKMGSVKFESATNKNLIFKPYSDIELNEPINFTFQYV